jgi:hypothetical protein
MSAEGVQVFPQLVAMMLLVTLIAAGAGSDLRFVNLCAR